MTDTQLTAEHAVLLVRYVKALFGRAFEVDEYTPDAWHDALARWPLADCKQAVLEISRRQAFISAGEVHEEVARIRKARIDRTPVGDPPLEVQASTDPRAYIDWLRDRRQAIADGDTELDAPAVTPGHQLPDVDRLLPRP